MEPAANLGFLISDVSRLMRRDFNRRVAALGLTQAQWRALAHLERNQGINQAALADILEVQPITLGRLIDRLEEAGWVERRRDPVDQRAFRLHLSAKAQPLLAEMQARAGETLSRALKGVSEEAVARLIDGLQAMKRNLVDAV